MGIALLTLSGLFQGFSALQRKTAAASRTAPARSAHPLRMVQPSMRPTITPRPITSICPPRATPLRVVRVCDAHGTGTEMGRLVISGRMADVCAELDRLAAREAAQQISASRH